MLASNFNLGNKKTPNDSPYPQKERTNLWPFLVHNNLINNKLKISPYDNFVHISEFVTKHFLWASNYLPLCILKQFDFSFYAKIDTLTLFLSKNVYNDVHCINGSNFIVFNIFQHLKRLHSPLNSTCTAEKFKSHAHV